MEPEVGAAAPPVVEKCDLVETFLGQQPVQHELMVISLNEHHDGKPAGAVRTRQRLLSSGTANPHGLHLRSLVDGDRTVARHLDHVVAQDVARAARQTGYGEHVRFIDLGGSRVVL